MAQIPSIKIDELIRSKRKTLGLTVTSDARLVVHAPKRLPLSYIEAFITQKADWILRKQAEISAARPSEHVFREGEPFFLLGERLTLHYAQDARRVSVSGDRLILPPSDAVQAEKRIEAWYRAKAREIFADRMAFYAPQMSVKPSGLRISGAHGQWGSCGANSSINLVWRLVMAPVEIVDYVVVHELAHLIRRDHSAEFWREVARILPDYAQRRRYLKQNGRLLDI